jgi:leucyl aminopeptidase
MPMPKTALVLFAAAALGIASAGASATDRPQRHADAAHARAEASDALASLRLEHDPFAQVYIVMSRSSHAHMPDLVRGAAPKVDRQGNRLVLAEVRAHQLSRITERIHQRERRCGGYFAFSTRAEAEAFLRNASPRPPLARKSPAMRVEYSIDSQATVSPWLDQVQHANIHATINHLQAYQNRYYASSYGRDAALWIQSTWMALAAGRSDVTSELFACASCSTQPSVILTIRGNEFPNEVVVLGGHLDSINVSGGGSTGQRAPGADDDASGIATLTEVLRIAMASGWKPKRTVKFMGYAAEEVGLRGSNAIAQAFKRSNVNVVAALQMDMTNYKSGSGPDMRLVTDFSDPHMQRFLTDLFDVYLAPRGLTRGTDTCGYACSDHASWTAAGYPSGFFFEGGTASGNGFASIHTSNDTLANMGNSAQNSARFAQLGLAFLGEAAKSSIAPTSKRTISR